MRPCGSRRKSRRRAIVSWRLWVASPFVRERGRVRGDLSLIDAEGAHPSPPAFARLRRGMQSSPLQQGERRDRSQKIQSDNQRTLRRRGNRIRFRMSWRVKKGQDALASSSLGASRQLHLTLFPQGPTATRACRLSEHRCNVRRCPTFLLTERWNCWHARTRVKCVRRLNQRELHLILFPQG